MKRVGFREEAGQKLGKGRKNATPTPAGMLMPKSYAVRDLEGAKLSVPEGLGEADEGYLGEEADDEVVELTSGTKVRSIADQLFALLCGVLLCVERSPTSLSLPSG
jgi:hypothetical protein